jgi:Ni/Co efflux regulator RcnB
MKRLLIIAAAASLLATAATAQQTTVTTGVWRCSHPDRAGVSHQDQDLRYREESAAHYDSRKNRSRRQGPGQC